MKKLTTKYFVIILTITATLLYSGKSIGQTFDTAYVSDLFSMSLEDMQNIKITSASKLEEDLLTAAASVYVITGEDIEKYGYRDLQEALKSVPSVYLSNPHSWVWGGQRGFLSNFSQTLLMVNGREVNNIIAFEGFISNQFSTYNIKQIEVVASPASAIYGANALAGVINIITKEVDKDYDGFELYVDAGSFNTKAISILFAKNLSKDLRISGSARYYTSDEEDFSRWTSNLEEFVPGWKDKEYAENYNGFGQYKNFSMSIPVNFQVDYKGIYAGVNAYYNLQSHGMEKASWDYTNNEDLRNFQLWYAGYSGKITDKLSVKLDYSNVRSKFWGRYSSGFWPTARLENPGYIEHYNFTNWTPNSGDRAGNEFQMIDYNRSNALVYDATLGDSLILQNYYSSFASYLIDQDIIDKDNITKDDVSKYFGHIYTNKESRGSLRDKIDLQFDYRFNNKHHLTFGYTFDYVNYVGLVVTDAGIGVGATYDIPVDLSKRNDVYTSIKNGIYAQYNGELLTDKLWLTFGARWDNQNHYGNSINPRGGVVYKPHKNTVLKALYNEAYREGNVFELSGKPDLDPAKLRGGELSFHQEIGKNIHTEFVYYNNTVSNFLGSVGSIIGENVTSVESQNVQGIENLTRFKINKFSGFFNAAYIISANQKATDKTTGDKVVVDLLGLPDLKMSLGVSYDITSHIGVSILNHYVSSMDAIGGSSGSKIKIDGYNDLSFNLIFKSYSINDNAKLTFNISVKNLLNQEYYHPNIRRSGTEKFLQNSRALFARLAIKI